MPTVPGPDLTKLRTTPQSTKMYLVVQQPMLWDEDADTYDTSTMMWFGTITTEPATDPNMTEPATFLRVTADVASPAMQIYDGMTIVVSKVGYGYRDQATLRAHGDQLLDNIGGGEQDLYIDAASGWLARDLHENDYIAILDETRLWTRHSSITEDTGVLTWYKHLGYFAQSIGGRDPLDPTDELAYRWNDQLGAGENDPTIAMWPPVPIMGPHAVKFIDPDVGSVDVYFDWQDSYVLLNGQFIDVYHSAGEEDHEGNWWEFLNNPTPGWVNYDHISGLRGFRVHLNVQYDGNNPIAEFRRGIRYVFTLRRPEDRTRWEELGADIHESDFPITEFEIDAMNGDYKAGGWTAQVRIFGSQASEKYILPGALVILFTEDTYGTSSGSVGPDDIMDANIMADRANIVLVGYIRDGSIRQDSESGDVTFEVISVTELMKNRECLSVPIEYNAQPSDWYQSNVLTVELAAHHYITWHTNLKLVADVYPSQRGEVYKLDLHEIVAQDFLAGDAYSTVDRFLWERIFARLLCDRFGRCALDIDVDMQDFGSGTTMWDLQEGDWIGSLQIDQMMELPMSQVNLAGLTIDNAIGLIIPYLSVAPGEVGKWGGHIDSMSNLSVFGQDELNLWAGRYLAKLNNFWPRFVLPLAGNWRVADIWPQEYVHVDQGTVRHDFDNDFIVREISFEYDAMGGVLKTTLIMEADTRMPRGYTVEIPELIPNFPEGGENGGG